MTTMEITDLQTELTEINAQLKEMVGSPDVSLGGFSVSESQLQKDLLERKASIEWRLGNPNGSANDNMRSYGSTDGGAY